VVEWEVVTPLGIVSVYVQRQPAYTRLDFVHHGWMYMRTYFGKEYSVRGIVTKSHDFAKEITRI
jgi:hypothetical protein